MPALGLDFERSLKAQPSEARRAVGEALREAGFQITAEQLTRIEAKRGSHLLGGALMPARMMPILALFEISPAGPACVISGHLVDHHINLGGKAWGWNQTYRNLFGAVQAAVDDRLARLDPAAAQAFEPPRFWSKGGEVAALEQAQSLGSKAGGTVVDKAATALEGGPKHRTPAAWKGLDSVTFISSEGRAVLSLAETQERLGLAVMIVSRPDSMPPDEVHKLEQFAVRTEQSLTQANGRAVTIEVDDAERPAIELLQVQARIRSGLPVRTLHICKDCHFQKVTNEDLARLQSRNRLLREIVGGVGATISSGGVKPFLMFGQFFAMKRLDPDYVCPGCQGLDADEQIVTYCPGCGTMRTEAVLGECSKCGLDFVCRLEPEPFWLAPEPEAAPADAPGAGPVAIDASPSEPGGWLFCPSCGSRLASDFAFCPGCGGRVST